MKRRFGFVVLSFFLSRSSFGAPGADFETVSEMVRAAFADDGIGGSFETPPAASST